VPHPRSVTNPYEWSRVDVDADDLGLNLGRLIDEQLLELGVAHYFRVVLEHLRNLRLFGCGEHSAVLCHVGERY